jgi:hypothetical protein
MSDGLQTVDGHLHVTLNPAAIFENVTGKYHVILRCGVFTYPTHPPFDATWTVSKVFYKIILIDLMFTFLINDDGFWSCFFVTDCFLRFSCLSRLPLVTRLPTPVTMTTAFT